MKITASPFYHALSGKNITPPGKGVKLPLPNWFNNRNTGPCGVYLWGFYTGNNDINEDFDLQKADEYSHQADSPECDFTIFYIGKIDHKGDNCGCNDLKECCGDLELKAFTNPEEEQFGNEFEVSKKKSNIGERMLQEWAWLFGGFYPTFDFNHFKTYPTNSNIWLYQQAKISKGPLLHKSSGLIDAYKNFLYEYADITNPNTGKNAFQLAHKQMKERLIFCWLCFEDNDNETKKAEIKSIESRLHKICGENILGLGQYKLGQSSKANSEFFKLKKGVEWNGNEELKRYLEKVSGHTEASHKSCAINKCKERIEKEIKKINTTGKTFYH